MYNYIKPIWDVENGGRRSLRVVVENVIEHGQKNESTYPNECAQ